MSIEAALAALTAAVEKNNELLSIVVATAAANMAKGKTDDKPATKADDKPATKPVEKKTTAKPPKVATPAEMAKATTDFLEVEDEDEYNARRALVKRIVSAHEVKKMSEIPEADRQKALDALTAHKAGEPTGYDDEEDMA